ncbi:MAG: GldG family protein, partial [Bdellovibrionales bacterium]|nr:GldG family protein [Bdellovibrionales bacterium]
MSRLGKGCLLLSVLSLVVLMATRTILGGWVNLLYIPLVLLVAGVIGVVVLERKTLVDFLTMRTTKHGMNMGVLILLGVVLMVSVNYLGVRFNKTVDVTEEKLNSLSEQSVKVLKSLDKDLTVYIFYKGEEAKDQRQAIKQNLTLYEESSPKIKVRTVNSYVEPALAQEYLGDITDKNRGEVFVFVNYGGKKIRVETEGPGQITEEKLTSAIIRATREGNKKIYFVTGHGERDLKGTDPEALSQLVESLEGASYKVEPINFTEKAAIPEDASLIAIVGPQAPYLDAELNLLRDYLRKGGRVVVAVDPGQHHNLSLLTKSVGVEFKNNYILNQLSQIVGRGLASAIGITYESGAGVTDKFQNGEMTIFDLASEVVPAPDVSENLKVTPLVKTHDSAFVENDIKNVSQPKEGDFGSRDVAVLSEGHLDGGKDEKTEFASVIFGDSDFMANKSFFQ